MSIEQRLKELGVTLPQVGGPLGNYVHAKRVGNLLYLSGKGPPDGPDGKMWKGKLGAGMPIDEGYRHARGVGLTIIFPDRLHTYGPASETARTSSPPTPVSPAS